MIEFSLSSSKIVIVRERSFDIKSIILIVSLDSFSIEVKYVIEYHIIKDSSIFIYMQDYPLQSAKYILRLSQICE